MSVRQGIACIAGFAGFCSVMPFVCGYNWTYGSTLEKLLNGMAYSALVFTYVCVILGGVAIASRPPAGNNAPEPHDNYQI